MEVNKSGLNSLKFLVINFDILIFGAFILSVIYAIESKNSWLLSISYILAAISYSATFVPNFKRKKEDERDSFLYYRANTYAFIATFVFLIIWILFLSFLPVSFNISLRNLLSTILCFAISSYNFFFIFLKRKY
jgi:hypothetical protein